MDFAETLAAAGRRRAEIDRRIAEAEQKLKERAAARKGKRGRMTSAEQAKENSLNALIVRLRAGYLPGEQMSAARAPADQVLASAQQNLQHHAAGGSAPPGRPAAAAASSSGGGGAAADGADGDDQDDDDDDQDPNFRNYYRVTSQQRAFNLAAKEQFKKQAASLSSPIFRPKDVIKAGCDRELIGVGACHVFAPHLYLGLPKPPCPKHDWMAVDKGCVATWGWCAARRVYADGIDEWVVGQKMICSICKKEHDAAAEVLHELKDDEFATAAELSEAEAAVKAARYVYRSYNPISMRLYAERYAWCVLLVGRSPLSRPSLYPCSLSLLALCTLASQGSLHPLHISLQVHPLAPVRDPQQAHGGDAQRREAPHARRRQDQPDRARRGVP